MIFDLDLPFLEEVVAVLDGQLDRLNKEARGTDDPDGFGVFDLAEHVTGLGFAACQNYVSSSAGLSRVSMQIALQLGPKHRTGHPMAELIHAGANYWKHSPEWGEEPADRERRTRELFSSLGVPPLSDYALTNFLHELVRPLPDRFGTLVPFLVHWREALAKPEK